MTLVWGWSRVPIEQSLLFWFILEQKVGEGMGLAYFISQVQKYYLILKSEIYTGKFFCVCTCTHTCMNRQQLLRKNK